MNPWYPKIAVLVSLLSFILIRWPHGNRALKVKIAEDRKNRLEVFLLLIAAVTTTLLPILWLTTSLFEFAEYPLQPIPYWSGVAAAIWGLWLLYLFRVKREEKMMVDQFGLEYEEYRKRTGRLIPRFGR